MWKELALASVLLGSAVGCQKQEPLKYSATPTIPPVPTETIIPPTATALPTRTKTPTAVPPTPTSEPLSLYQTIVNKLRNRSAETETNVNPKLKEIGPVIVFLLCGYDHGPPTVYRVYICANTTFVLGDPVLRISTTHDMRFPEAELPDRKGKPLSAARSDQLVLGPASGFPVIHEAFQDAYGLRVDRAIIFKDQRVVADYFNKAFGKLKVKPNIAFTAHPIWLDEKTLSKERFFPDTEQEMDGMALLQYITSTPKSAGKYAEGLENQERIKIIIEAMEKELESQKSPIFWANFLKTTADFFDEQTKSGNLVADFNIKDVVVDSIRAAAGEAAGQVLSGKMPRIGLPKMGGQKYFVDASAAIESEKNNAAVRWGAIESGDPYANKDIADGVYPPSYVEIPNWEKICEPRKITVPCGADPYSPNLADKYWRPVRTAVEDFVLLGK